VLVGDYLLSKGLLLSVENNDHRLLKIVSEAVKVMSEGELLQIEKARRLDIEENIYFEIIRQKTASLIASCCACGASSTNAGAEVVGRMHQFGEYIGMAFQVKDDLFDYGPDGIIGKPTGIDIKESKMTLPLIYALGKTDRSTKRHIVNIIKNHNTESVRVKEVIDFVKQNGGMEYAIEKMKEYQAKAFVLLDHFSENIYKEKLKELVRFTIEREQ